MSAVYGTKTPTESVGASATTGMLDLNALRLPQDFAANLGVKKLLVNVPVTKPRKHWFVRSRPGDAWRARVAMIVLKEEGENYVVDPRLAADLPDDVVHFDLVTAINRHGTVFLWQLRVPNSSHRDTWADSAIAACTYAEMHWVKTTANMKASAYDVAIATAPLPEPEWPDESFEKLFHLAFRDQVIGTIDHPVIQQLKGTA